VELDRGEDSDAAGACDKAQPAKRRKGSAKASQPAAQPGKVKAHGAAGARLAFWESLRPRPSFPCTAFSIARLPSCDQVEDPVINHDAADQARQGVPAAPPGAVKAHCAVGAWLAVFDYLSRAHVYHKLAALTS